MIRKLRNILQAVNILLQHRNVLVISHDESRHSYYIFTENAQDTLDVLKQVTEEHIPNEANQELTLREAKKILNN